MSKNRKHFQQFVDVFKLLRIFRSILRIISSVYEIINNDFKITVKIPDSLPGKTGNIKKIDPVVVHKRPVHVRYSDCIVKGPVLSPGLFSKTQDQCYNRISGLLSQFCPIGGTVVANHAKWHILIICALVLNTQKRNSDIDLLP